MGIKHLWRMSVGAALLMAAAAACAFLANTCRPSGRIAWAEDWSRYVEARAREEGLALADLRAAEGIAKGQAHLIFDARPAADYEAGHLPGAFSLPYTEVEDRLLDVQDRLTPAQPIMVYCSGTECDESFLLSRFLKQQGFTNVVLFAGGFGEWEKAGQPVVKGAAP